MPDPIIKIDGKDYKLKITLGFWKKLSFSQAEFNSIYINGVRLGECLKLALFYGNKNDEGWKCIADMENALPEDVLDDIEYDVKEPLGLALINNMPESLRKKVEEEQKDLEENTKKK